MSSLVRSRRALTAAGLSLSLAALAALPACTVEAPGASPEDELAATLASAVVAARPGFYFYPPLAPEPAPSGVFVADRLTELSVRIEHSDGLGGWVNVTTLGAQSSPRLYLKPDRERYMVNLRLADYFTDRSATYRFRVTMGMQDLGTADMPAAVFNFIDRYPNIVMGLMFRLERGALDRDGDGIPDELDHCPDFADASNPVPSVEVCDGRDNDCSGTIDENNPGGGVPCTTGRPGVCAGGVTRCTGGEIVCEATVAASAETCNGLDDDCDGQVDEGFGTLSCGTGACAVTIAACAGGVPQTCVPGAPEAESCDGIDNDCDGVVDNGCLCVHGTVEACYSGGMGTLGVGPCHAGTHTCDHGAWTACTGEVVPSAEVCNGRDDDCSGAADEGNPGGGGACQTGQPGVCAPGVLTCTTGGLVCVRTTAPSAEACDGLDNDCNGTVDDGCECIDGQTRSCYDGPAGTLGVGPCTGGTQLCAGGRWGACQGEVLPTNHVRVESRFDSSTEGWTVANDGSAPYLSSGTLVIDDLGDGRIWYFVAPASYRGDLSWLYGGTISFRLRVSDTGIAAGSDSVVITGANGVTMQIGAATPGTSWTSYDVAVTAGGWTDATSNAVLTEAQVRAVLSNVTRLQIRGEFSAARDTGYLDDVTLRGQGEVCNGIDDDCSGAIDEGNPGGGAACTTGVPGLCSPGTMMCSGGALICAQTVFPTAEVCDGLDNDCNGTTDPGCACINGQTRSCYTGAAGTSGVGLCHGGTQTCASGQWGTCVGEVVPAAEACDGVDNSCDGRIDEGCSAVSSTFSGTTDGWSYAGDGGSTRLTTFSGNQALTVSDTGAGIVWYFLAPSRFLGDLSAMYGGRITFRQAVSTRDTSSATDHVLIYGANGVTMRMAGTWPAVQPTFTSYSYAITAGSWQNASTGAVLTEAQIRAVLANVTALRIRGEFSSALDVGYLDDVTLVRAP